MQIDITDVKLTHYGEHNGAFIKCSVSSFIEIQDHIVTSSKVYNEILANIKYDKLKCLCKLEGYCSYCKHRIQLEMILE